MMFALSSISLVAASGAAVDISRTIVAKNRLSEALDAAGLAVGTTSGLTQAQQQALAQKYFTANYPTNAIGTTGTVNVVTDGVKTTLSVTGNVPTTLLKIIGINQLGLSVTNEVTHGSLNLEVALALDVTGSMSGQKIADLRDAATELVDLVVQDVQTPYYSKVAIAPYSMAVNVGTTYADQVRGPITAGKTITNATWVSGSTKLITLATKANPVVITSVLHGLSNGDTVYISGVGGMSQINNKKFTVANKTANTFQLSGVNGSSYSTFSVGGSIRKCINADCEVVVTATAHGFTNGSVVYIDGVNGMTQLNDNAYTVENATTDTFSLAGEYGPDDSNYTSSGTAYCTVQGCRYYQFTNEDGDTKLFEVTTCATERTGANAFLDVAPSIQFLGRNYRSGDCLDAKIQPLSSSKTTLKNLISGLQAGGSTGGHVGLAWAWYMISPNFGYLWPAASQPAAYGAESLLKVLVLMTDGNFNTAYCNGVIAADSTSGSGSNSDHINCNAPNGHDFVQSQALCTKIKQAGVIVYTVGFDVDDDVNAESLMASCASDSAHAYLASDGAALTAAFVAIAQDINSLRLSK